MSGNAADTCHVIGKRRFCRSRWHLHGIRDSLTDAGLRTALCAIGAAQITVGALGIIDSSRYQQSSAGFATSVGHLQHESAALHAAIGIGLAVAALRKTPIDGLFPTVVVFLLTLALLSVTDIPGLVAQPAGLVPYALMITACLILVALPHVRASAMEQQHPQSDVPPRRRHVDRSNSSDAVADLWLVAEPIRSPYAGAQRGGEVDRRARRRQRDAGHPSSDRRGDHRQLQGPVRVVAVPTDQGGVIEGAWPEPKRQPSTVPIAGL
ncbi:hypothetical protein [Micromonospora sp. NBC_01813]|uniref:hypothetical protein n=1 Tax=Micromonospora sp. NBC_01813 TaxID=2975988 RepID=UPI002DDA945D|nr:hypothetical protein [Micromonospora sp. NBC_01813]WSA10824.1 hypothetical protein OG958_08600 [Micromonospora sp. NBC_01813]